MNTVKKNYFNKATTKDSAVFLKYLCFIDKSGINLQGKNVCDIGCATGNFISQIIETSNCYGIDYSEYAIEFCKNKFKKIKSHFSVIDLNNKTEIPFRKKFDLVTMFDVIEHIGNLSTLSQLLKSSIQKGGYLLITTPNANNFLRFINKKYFTGEMDKTHINLFTPYTLDFFLRVSGFEKVELSTPYNFYFRNNWVTKKIMLGGQIFAIYKRKSK